MAETALSARSQFFCELQFCVSSQEEEQQHFIALARQGDRWARHQLIESFLPKIGQFARVYAARCHHLELLDIIQSGVEVLLNNLDRALQHSEPIAYLCLTVRNQLLTFCQCHDSLIDVPAPQYAQVCQVGSFDTPVSEDGMTTLADVLPAPAPDASSSEEDYATLYQALGQLSERHRDLIIRRYGLFCHAPISQTDLGREWYPDEPVSRAVHRIGKLERGALRSLKRALLAAELAKKFYTAADIKRLYGCQSLQWYVAQGRLTRNPAPFEDASLNGQLAYVYDREEVDAFFVGQASQQEVA